MTADAGNGGQPGAQGASPAGKAETVPPGVKLPCRPGAGIWDEGLSHSQYSPSRETVHAGPLRAADPCASVTPAAQERSAALPAQSFPVRTYRVCGLPPVMSAASSIRVTPWADCAENTVTRPVSTPDEGSATVLADNVGWPVPEEAGAETGCSWWRSAMATPR